MQVHFYTANIPSSDYTQRLRFSPACFVCLVSAPIVQANVASEFFESASNVKLESELTDVQCFTAATRKHFTHPVARADASSHTYSILYPVHVLSISGKSD